MSSLNASVCLCLTSGAREGEDRPPGRCDGEQEKDEGAGGQPAVSAHKHTGKELCLMYLIDRTVSDVFDR